MEQRTALLDEWAAKQREIAVLQSEASALLARRWELWQEEVTSAPQHRDAIERSMMAEYSAAGHVSQSSMTFAFADAHLLATEFDTVRESYAAGRITPGHVREILREAAPVREAIEAGDVDASTLLLYEAAALETAENDTAARTRVQARRIAAALAGSTIVEQHKRAAAERTVTVRSIGDGLVLLQAVLPEHLGVAILDRLTKMARHMQKHPEDRRPEFGPSEPEDVGLDPETLLPVNAGMPDADDGAIFGSHTFTADPFELPLDPKFHDDSPRITHVPPDTRTMDQLRADLFTDLLLASTPTDAHGTGLENIHATIQVTVAATTVAGDDDRPAEFDGFGPLAPDVARRLAGQRTGWTRLFLDATGMVVETDTYTPTEQMRRFLRARDQHCRFPGCRAPIHRCEADHNQDWALGGKTHIDNLAHFCGMHHPIKHPDIPDSHRWYARQLPDRSVEWISPNGRHYRDLPNRRVMFVPSIELSNPPGSPHDAGPDPTERPPF
ncbi:HNH endonuclease [Actinomycetales bacterium SN12]|nr:HNH endonuclease [Actinomycetales bacterium SN12]